MDCIYSFNFQRDSWRMLAIKWIEWVKWFGKVWLHCFENFWVKLGVHLSILCTSKNYLVVGYKFLYRDIGLYTRILEAWYGENAVLCRYCSFLWIFSVSVVNILRSFAKIFEKLLLLLFMTQGVVIYIVIFIFKTQGVSSMCYLI